MSYDIYRYIFLGGAGLAALSLIIAAFLFFVLKIPKVIGDLTGATARKAIDDIRSQNEKSGEKTYKSSRVNRERGMLTDKMTNSGNVVKHSVDIKNGAMSTSKISTSRLETEALESYETSLLDNNLAETTVLDSFESGETTVLEQSDADVFIIEYELNFIHTNEIIV